jgi:peroxiredoxin
LLSDWNGHAVEAFDNAINYRGLERVAERSAFLLDGDGMIIAAWRYEVGELPDFDELLASARSAS